MIFNNNSKNESQKLTKELKELGISFYEDFYYNQIGKTDEEKKTFLEKYTDIGIKVSLDNLARYKKDESEEIIKKFVNSKTNKNVIKQIQWLLFTLKNLMVKRITVLKQI